MANERDDERDRTNEVLWRQRSLTDLVAMA